MYSLFAPKLLSYLVDKSKVRFGTEVGLCQRVMMMAINNGQRGASHPAPRRSQHLSSTLGNSLSAFLEIVPWVCCAVVCFIYLFFCLYAYQKGEKKECTVQKTKFITSPTWWGAGSIERGAGAGGITGATGLSLVEGPFQLPPPLDPAVLLTEVLEDLLCGGQTGNKKNRIKKTTLTHTCSNTETFGRRNDGECKLSRIIWCKL